MTASPLSRARRPLLLGATALFGLVFGALPAPAAGSDDSGLYADFLTSRFAQSQSDPHAAAHAALDALALDPGNPNLLNQAFLSTALAGRPEALGLARMLPREPFAQLMIVDVAVERHEWLEATQAASRLPSDGVMQVLRPILLAWIDAAQHRTNQAVQRLQPLIDDGQFRVAAALHAGMIADLAGRTQQAAGYFATATASFGPLDLRPAIIIASFDLRTGRQAEALGLLGHNSEANPEFGLVLPKVTGELRRPPITSAAGGIAEAYLATAGTLQTQGQTDLAALLLRYALNLNPDFSPAKLQLAAVLRGEGRRQEAQELVRGISPDDPLHPIAQVRIAQLLHDQGDDAGALDLLAQVAGECPQSALPVTQRAELLRGDGRLAEADAAYDEALSRIGESGPTAWMLLYERAMVRDQMNDWPAAEADLKHALSLAPNQPVLLNYLGYSWADRDIHLDDAARMIAEANREDPNNAPIVDSMGWVKLKQGDVEGAIRLLERANELMPSDATINGHLGDAYAAAGRKLEARYQWQRALTLHPDPAETSRLRMKLEGGIRQSARAQTDG